MVLILLLGAAGSFYQVTSGLFYCGHTGANSEIWYWALAAGLQSLAFPWAGWSPRGERFYRLTQWAAVPLIAYVLYQLSAVHARPLFLAGLAVLAYALFARALDRRRHPEMETSWSQLGLQGVLFVLAALVIQSAFAFLVLYSRGILLNDRNFGVLLGMSVVLAFVVVRYGSRVHGVRLHEMPPLFLLLMILLRAKLPDGAYDSLFYKATLPMMIADWRTALTGLPDHTLLGTNLQEILNAQLLIIDGGYAPSFITTLAFLGLWIVVPAAARTLSNVLPVEASKRHLGLMLNTATLLLVSLSEPLTAAGTSYQEPLQILLLAAGLLAGPAGWIFLAAAAAVKVTALFFIPLLLLIRAAGVDRECVRAFLETPFAKLRGWHVGSYFNRGHGGAPTSAPWRPARTKGALLVLLVCGGLAALVFGEQLARNQLFAGRLLVPSEMLAGLTDPDGRMMTRIKRDETFDIAGTQRPFDNLIGTLIHMGTLNKWMEPDAHGFHALPSSRLPMVAVFLALLALWCVRKREARPWALLTLFFTLLFVVYLQFFSQGRHMAPASFAAVVAIAAAPVFLWKGEMPRWLLAVLTLAIGLLAVGDQLVGNFINTGWECSRRLSTPAAAPIAPVARDGVSNAATELDRKLADIVAQYRAKAPARHDIIPSVLCDETQGRKHYFGAHYAYASVTHSLLRRYLSADPARAQRLARSALVVCVEVWHLLAVKPDGQEDHFTLVDRVGRTNIFVSNFLMDGGPAAQLVPAGFPVPSSWIRYMVVQDFGASWSTGRLADPSPQETPNGKGALEMSVGAETLPTLVSRNAMTFDEVEVRPGDRVFMEATLPFRQSDGLQVELRLVLAGTAPLVRRMLLQPNRSIAPDMSWQTLALAVPDGYSGRATLTVAVSSEGGDPNADWISFRKLQLQRRVQ